MPRVIGLTGGIATGKSTVARILSKQGVLVCDADELARQAVQPGSEILAEVVAHFGPAVLTREGALDRAQLGRIVFGQPAERAWLEARIHPYVRAEMERQLRDGAAQAVICLMIPLLFEANMQDLVGEIWTVICSEAQQIERIQSRDRHLSEAEIRARLASQWPLARKIASSQVVIDNSGSHEDLEAEVLRGLNSNLPSPCHRKSYGDDKNHADARPIWQ